MFLLFQRERQAQISSIFQVCVSKPETEPVVFAADQDGDGCVVTFGHFVFE